MDQFVLATLDAIASTVDPDDDRFVYKSDYSDSTYVAAVTQMQKWAKISSERIGREIAPDEVERWAFITKGIPD